jgi:hypothetical protein
VTPDARPLACPSCAKPMEPHRFARHVHGEVIIDVCWRCHAIWFDQYESAQLSPESVIALFRRIHEHRAQPPGGLADHMRCPRCTRSLELVHDMQRHNRLRYHRCPDGHGRITSFMQFLREKEFVRSLSTAEIASLKASVGQVRCSSCGAVVDLSRDAACRYCRSALAVIDAEAVEKALASLTNAAQKQANPESSVVADAFAALLLAHKSRPHESLWLRDLSAPSATPSTAGGVVDLLVAGLGRLFDG